jgi:hypothetical protein
MNQSLVKPTLAAAAAVLLLTLPSKPADASDPSRARYTDDPSRVFWFLHISDTHIDSPYYESEELKLEWSLTTGVDVVGPWFVAVTGDLTDASYGLIPGAGQQEDEWREYRRIVDAAGMMNDFYYDMPGNHDAFFDGELTWFLDWSLQGFTRHTTQPDWMIDLPFGCYHFVSIATPDNDGLVDPLDTPEVTDWEYNEVLASLDAFSHCNLTIAMGHHEYETADGGDAVDALLAAYNVPYYIHGHKHDYRAKVSTRGVVIQRIDALGKSDQNNFCVHAVDADCISHTCVSSDDPWPLAVITAPVDARLDNDDDVNNPYALSVPTSCEAAPLRVLVFDAIPVSTVTYWFDTPEAGPLTQSSSIPEQWTGTFDARSFSPGVQTLHVEVIGTRTRDFAAQILFEDRACDLAPPPMDEDAPEIPDVAEEVPEADVSEDVAEGPDGESDVAQPDVTVDFEEEDAEEEDDGGIGDLYGGGCSCTIR